MADFFQNGVITTLQKLKDRDINEIETELRNFSQKRNRKIVLLLPALYSEFEGPAMPKIIEELKKVDYLYKIVLSLDRADEEHRLQKLYYELKKKGFWLDIPGKGRSVWMTLGYILADTQAYAIALHDTDIVNYKRELLARLVYPVVHPALDFEFSKGYYARVTNKLYGRVTRLFYTPLIRALHRF